MNTPTMLTNYKEFIDRVTKSLAELQIDVSKIKIDHLGYLSASNEDYDQKKFELSQIGTIIHDVQVGDVSVAIYELFEPLKYKDDIINAIEIVSPKPGATTKSDWEHIEYLVNGSLEEFMKLYPKLDWIDSALNRDIFPMLTLKLDEKTRAKFPRRSAIIEAQRIKSIDKK